MQLIWNQCNIIYYDVKRYSIEYIKIRILNMSGIKKRNPNCVQALQMTIGILIPVHTKGITCMFFSFTQTLFIHGSRLL